MPDDPYSIGADDRYPGWRARLVQDELSWTGTRRAGWRLSSGVVALLLLITYRSPLLLFLPPIAVGVANQLAGALVYVSGRLGEVR